MTRRHARIASVLILAGAAAPLPAQTPAELESRIEAIVAAAPGEVGVALIDLETGLRIGIRDDVSMHAASTMKVPVLIELFRQAAEGRWALTDSIVVRNEFISIADGSRYSLTAEDDSESALYRIVGRELSRLELARRMIVQSSNLATNILIEEIGAENVRVMMGGLGAADMVVLRGVEDIPAYERGMNNTTTAAAFARVLEALARCEQGDVADALRPLTPPDCREITQVLAQQRFDEKIPAGVPAGVRVANKTGWITEIDHDGAIVYPPGRAPYVLVVLTRGIADRTASTAVARDISRAAWDALVRPTTVSTLPTPALVALHERHRIEAIRERDFTHAELWDAIAPLIDASSALTREQVGTS
ncbi:MAG: serine hydrolase, partial [Longimicrobiales bacterium]